MRDRRGSLAAIPSGKHFREALASSLPGSLWPWNWSGWRLAGAVLGIVILATVAIVLAWGDTLSFPKLLDKQIPTHVITLGADSQGDLERGVIPGEVRRALSAEEAGLSDLAAVSTVVEEQEWLILAPRREFIAVMNGDVLNIGGGLLNVSGPQYQEDLAKETFPEGLREEFRLIDVGLSDRAKVSTLEEGRSWLIIDPRKKYSVAKQSQLDVGDITLVVDPTTPSGLNDGIVSEELKFEFRRKEIGLSDTATVSTLEEGGAWRVTDADLGAAHTVTRGQDQLIIDEIEDKDIFLNEDIASGIDFATKYVTTEGKFVFDFIGSLVKKVLTWIEDALLWVPYPVLICGVALLAWRMASFEVGIFSACSLLTIGFVGLWPSAMETLSLMVTAVAVLHLHGDTYRDYRRPQQQGGRGATSVAGYYADHAQFRIFGARHLFLWLGQRPRGDRHHNLRRAPGHKADQPGYTAGFPGYPGGGHGLWGDAAAASPQGADASSFANHNGGYKPDHYDGVGHGGGGFPRGRRRPGGGRAQSHRPAANRQQPPGGDEHRLLGHHHRPHHPGVCHSPSEGYPGLAHGVSIIGETGCTVRQLPSLDGRGLGRFTGASSGVVQNNRKTLRVSRPRTRWTMR